MENGRYDVTGIGNAIVDVLAKTDDRLLEQERLSKGSMTLIDEARARELYEKIGPTIERSGGSAGNTMAGLASLGGKGAYIGKVHRDTLGDAFTQDMLASGTHFSTQALSEGPATARCLVMVTPDAQRTMSTFLGACVELSPADIDAELIQASKVTYLEGYLWDPPQAKQAFIKASTIAHAAKNQVALSLSDTFCVARHREEFRDLVEHHVDVLFANEDEILSLYECATLDEAIGHVKGRCQVAALTRSERGAVVIAGDRVHTVDAERVEQVVDTTGAGDLYAAGFLYGYTRGQSCPDCGRLGALAAAEVIGHYGARPESSLKEWIADRM
jgi:sugar/nucleoside kinase (ribokinase family)